MERRDLFKVLGATALVDHLSAATQFLTPEQAAMIDRLAEVIIPGEPGSPGAHEAGVVRYFDLMLLYADARQQKTWQLWLTRVGSDARRRFGKPFAEIGNEQVAEMVGEMAANEGKRNDDMGRFFVALKRWTVEGYHYSGVNWKNNVHRHDGLATEFPGCTHPEHKNFD